MSEKRTPPTTDSARQNKHTNCNTVLRFAELETLRLLIKKPHNRFELGYKIMSGYAPNEVKALRDILGQESIETVWQPYLRRDGKTTRIGVYHLHDIDKALKLLERCAA